MRSEVLHSTWENLLPNCDLPNYLPSVYTCDMGNRIVAKLYMLDHHVAWIWLYAYIDPPFASCKIRDRKRSLNCARRSTSMFPSKNSSLGWINAVHDPLKVAANCKGQTEKVRSSRSLLYFQGLLTVWNQSTSK